MRLNYQRDRPDIKISVKTRVNGSPMVPPDSLHANYSLVSRLEISSVTEKHSGNYTCTAPHTVPASIQVFITEGKILYRKLNF